MPEVIFDIIAQHIIDEAISAGATPADVKWSRTQYDRGTGRQGVLHITAFTNGLCVSTTARGIDITIVFYDDHARMVLGCYCGTLFPMVSYSWNDPDGINAIVERAKILVRYYKGVDHELRNYPDLSRSAHKEQLCSAPAEPGM